MTSTDERTRVAERTGEWSAVALECARRGDRAGAVLACARQARAELASTGDRSRDAAKVWLAVRRALCSLLPCPVGRWVDLERMPRLTETEEATVRAVALD